MHDHPVSNVLHSRPIELFFDDAIPDDPDHPIVIAVDDPIIAPLPADIPALLDANNVDDHDDVPLLQYVLLDVSTVHPSRRRLFARIQMSFSPSSTPKALQLVCG